MLEKIKVALRVSNPYFDSEILDLIEACKQDLKTSGIAFKELDALCQRACILFCKINFGIENKDADRFQKSYDLLKLHMAHSLEYQPTEVI